MEVTALWHSSSFHPRHQVRSFLVRWSKRKEGFERINRVDEKGRGALSLALKEGREDIADFIISIGEANPNISDKYVSACTYMCTARPPINLPATHHQQGYKAETAASRGDAGPGQHYTEARVAIRFDCVCFFACAVPAA